MRGLIGVATTCVRRLHKTAWRNLERAFPEKDSEWRRKIIEQSDTAMARTLVDLLRLKQLKSDSGLLTIECANEKRLRELVQQRVPIIIATGHLGSFELLAHYLASIGVQLSFVARPIKPPPVNRWCNEQRTSNGNEVIERSGALKGTLRNLNAGKAVGILFDHNILRYHAAFVNWFGHRAATSRLVGIAAIRCEAVVMVTSIQYLGPEHYVVHAEECDFDELYRDETQQPEEKILAITREISARYEAMIRANPAEWFWTHKRWKTAPEGAPEDFYD